MERKFTKQEIENMVNECGVINAVEEIFGEKAFVRLPFSISMANKKIEEMDLTVRSYNALKRSGVFTINDLIDVINDKKINKIHNLGRKSIIEIYSKLLQFGYDGLSEEERKKFLNSLTALNQK